MSYEVHGLTICLLMEMLWDVDSRRRQLTIYLIVVEEAPRLIAHVLAPDPLD